MLLLTRWFLFVLLYFAILFNFVRVCVFSLFIIYIYLLIPSILYYCMYLFEHKLWGGWTKHFTADMDSVCLYIWQIHLRSRTFQASLWLAARRCSTGMRFVLWGGAWFSRWAAVPVIGKSLVHMPASVEWFCCRALNPGSNWPGCSVHSICLNRL